MIEKELLNAAAVQMQVDKRGGGEKVLRTHQHLLKSTEGNELRKV